MTLLRDSIDTISELIDEAEIDVKENGIEIKSSDRAVVVVVNFFLSKNLFSSYNSKETKIGLNLSNFLQILKRVKTEEKISFSLQENKLILMIKGEYIRKFTIPLIEISKEDAPDLKKLEAGFSSSLEINSDVLNKGIEDADLVTDSIILTLRKDMFSLKAENDQSSSNLEIQNNTKSLKIENVNEPIRARYSLDYLKKIIKARKLADTIKISMATDYPMKINFEQHDKLNLSFILAPRVEEN